MKRFLPTLLILLAFLLGLFLSFPQEAVLGSLSDLAARRSGIQISWEEGSFSPFKTTLKKVEIASPDKKLMELSSVEMHPSLLGVGLSFKEGEMKGRLTTFLSSLSFNIEEIAFTTALPPGKLSVEGRYDLRSGKGQGRFKAAFTGALFPMSTARDVTAEGPFTVTPKELALDFTIGGKGASGKGKAGITWQKNMKESPISGEIEFREEGKSVKITLSGTLGSPLFNPAVQ